MNYDKTIALVGQPNVGKSVIMQKLTGVRTAVSNYPGTTVEIARGIMEYNGSKISVVDTPGTYTLHSDTEEQRVTQLVLMEEPIDLIVNIVDATNLARNLYFTLQLIDFGLPMIVILNQMDRAKSLGIEINTERLSQELGVKIIPAVGVTGEGINELKKALTNKARPGKIMEFSEPVKKVIDNLSNEIKKNIDRKISRHNARTLAIHLLEHDKVDEEIYKLYPGFQNFVEKMQKEIETEVGLCPNCFRGCAFCPARDEKHPIFMTCIERTERARAIYAEVTQQKHREKTTLSERIETLMDNPIFGIPILILLAYLCYKFLVLAINYSEEGLLVIMRPLINAINNLLNAILPAGIYKAILINSIAEGILIPFTIVMPAMLIVYIILALLEDTGILSRYAVALDKITSIFDLQGQSVIPLILGLGCRVPAALATRTLPDRRQRIIVCALLSIVIPCAASIGIISGVIVKFKANILVIILSLVIVFMLIGLILKKILPGKKDEITLEVPPLRMPKISNLMIKTGVRMKSFFTHVLPLLLLASIGVRILIESKIINKLNIFSPLFETIFGIRAEAFMGVVLTIFQKYLGPTVLLNLTLSPREATIASAMIMLSLPCLPLTIVLIRELGWRDFLKIFIMALFTPIIIGFLLNLILPS